jgi:hypothetical protein
MRALLWTLPRFRSRQKKEKEKRFDAIADRALDKAVGITLRKKLGTTTLAPIAVEPLHLKSTASRRSTYYMSTSTVKKGGKPEKFE